MYLHIILGQFIRCQVHRSCKAKIPVVSNKQIHFGFVSFLLLVSLLFLNTRGYTSRKQGKQAGKPEQWTWAAHASPHSGVPVGSTQAACTTSAMLLSQLCSGYASKRFISQLLINPHMLRKSTVPASCLTPTLQSSCFSSAGVSCVS